MADDDPGSGGEDLAAQLRRWAAGAAVAAAVGERTRERWMRQQAGEAATVAGILVDLAEQNTPVVLTLAGGARSGRVTGVGRDFCVVEGASTAVVALRAVVAVAPAGPLQGDRTAAPRAADGDRAAPLDLDLIGVLGLLGADRSPVRLILTGGATVTGDVVGVGADLVEVRTSAPGRRTTVVPVAAVEACEPG